MAKALTTKARRALEIVRDHGPIKPSWFAKKMWPDAPGWQRFSKCGPNGAHQGSGMMMAGGGFLAKLRRRGLVSMRFRASYHEYELTTEGQEALHAALACPKCNGECNAEYPHRFETIFGTFAEVQKINACEHAWKEDKHTIYGYMRIAVTCTKCGTGTNRPGMSVLFDGDYVSPARQLRAASGPTTRSEYMDWFRKVVLRSFGVSEEMLAGG